MIKCQYIVDEQNHKVAVQLDIKTFEQIEEMLENYALVNLMENSEDSEDNEILDFENEGVRLWLKLREELHTTYFVEYFSQTMQKHLVDPSELNPQNGLPINDDNIY